MNNTLDFEAPALELEQKLTELRNRQIAEGKKVVSDVEIRKLERNLQKTRDAIYSNLSAWQKVQIARHPQRPYCLDYIKRIFTEFVELHGDRRFSDDHAMVGGFARLEEQPVMVIGTQKGRDTRENIYRNFGCAHPEGYRKALRLMQLADKFSVPIISLIDTAGAFPGVGAEERHIAESIAVNLREMFCLRVPVIAAVIGEGGSGGSAGGTGERPGAGHRDRTDRRRVSKGADRAVYQRVRGSETGRPAGREHDVRCAAYRQRGR